MIINGLIRKNLAVGTIFLFLETDVIPVTSQEREQPL